MNKLTVILLFAVVVGACIAQNDGNVDGAVDGEIDAQEDRRMRCRCGKGPLSRMFNGEKPMADGEMGEGRVEGERRGPPRGGRDGQGEGGRRGGQRGEGEELGEGGRRGPRGGNRGGQREGEGGRRGPPRGEGQGDGERPQRENGERRPKCQCRPRGERAETENSA